MMVSRLSSAASLYLLVFLLKSTREVCDARLRMSGAEEGTTSFSSPSSSSGPGRGLLRTNNKNLRHPTPQNKEEDKEKDESIRCLLIAAKTEYLPSGSDLKSDIESSLSSTEVEWKCLLIHPTAGVDQGDGSHNNYRRLVRVQGLEARIDNIILMEEEHHARRMKMAGTSGLRGSGNRNTITSNIIHNQHPTVSNVVRMGIRSGETELVISVRNTSPSTPNDDSVRNRRHRNQIEGDTLHLSPSSANLLRGHIADGSDMVDFVDRFSRVSLLQKFRQQLGEQHLGTENHAEVAVEHKEDWGPSRRRRTSTSIGTKSTLVVRATIGNDDASTLSQAIFGDLNNVTDWSLRSGIAACSHGQLDLAPATWPLTPDDGSGAYVVGVNLIQDGVLSVNIGGTVPSSRQTAMVAMWFGAESLLGLGMGDGRYLETTFDHVMFCIPIGTKESWVAEGWVNHPFSLFNDDWCKYPTAQMHEIGHNLNLEHAKDAGGSYGDLTGPMGASYKDENGPKMCYNPANNYQLGWYLGQQLDWDPLTQGSLTTRLVGAVDYNMSNTDPFTNVVVRLGLPNSGYFLGYNKAAGANSGTYEAQNQVTVTRYGGLGSDGKGTETYLLAKLSQGQQYRIENYQSGPIQKPVVVFWSGWSNDAPVVDVFVEG